MYARSTTIRGNPQSMDEGIAYVRDTVMPAVQQMDGCVGLSMLADRESGRCIVTAAWEDEAAMRASADGVSTLREQAREVMGGEMEYLTFTATTDARFFNLYYDVPATCYGPEGGNLHAPDEWVDLESVRQVTKVLATTAMDWCGVA